MQRSQKTQSYAKVISQVQLQSIQKTNKKDLPRVSGTRTTSSTLQTLDPEKSEYVDYLFYDKLPYMVNKYSSKYDGSAHANWSRNLTYLYQKQKIPIVKIEEYIIHLTKHMETIKHWNVENTLDTFTLLFKIGFFDQLESLGNNKEDVIFFRNLLMNQIDEKLHEIPIKEKNAISYLFLLKSILTQINYDRKISPISEKLLNQIHSSLMKTQELLSPYHYKEILQTITEIGSRINNYVPMFKLLIYKHLACMVNAEINSANEVNFAVYLSGISSLITQNFPIEDNNKNNLIQLIDKIEFTRDSGMAILGLKSITIIVDKKKIPLKSAEKKINECIDFLQDKNLNLEQTSFVLVSVIKYINLLDSLSDNLRKIIDKNLTTLVKNKDILPFKTLQAILKALRYLVCFDYPVSTILRQFSEVINKNTIHFFNSPSSEIHATVTNLTKTLVHTKKEFNDQLIIQFTNFLTTLMPKYLATIIDAPLSEMVNSFITLSNLINSGYFANINMKSTFNSLLSKIDSKIHLLNHKQLINFFRVVCLNYNLFILNDEETIAYANKLLEFTSSKDKIQKLCLRSQSITLWCMLVFYETNHEKLSESLLNKFKDVIISLYKALDKAKQNNEITNLQSTPHLFAANWLGYKVKEPFVQDVIGNTDVQTQCLRTLQAKFEELHFEEEQSINGLPPCDIAVHDKKIAIEVQGMHHFLDIERTLVNGTTILKNALLRKNNYHVIEVKVVDGKISDIEMKACFDKIEKVLNQIQSLQKVKF